MTCSYDSYLLSENFFFIKMNLGCAFGETGCKINFTVLLVNKLTLMRETEWIEFDRNGKGRKGTDLR